MKKFLVLTLIRRLIRRSGWIALVPQCEWALRK